MKVNKLSKNQIKNKTRTFRHKWVKPKVIPFIHSIFTDKQAGGGWCPVLSLELQRTQPFLASPPLFRTPKKLPSEAQEK